MATFQIKVLERPAVGVPGGFASVNPVVTTAIGKFASEDVKVGAFCWDDPEVEGAVKSCGSKTPADKPLGFVAREANTPFCAIDEAEAFVVPKGYNVSVHVNGDFCIEVPESVEKVTKGTRVLVDAVSGEVVKTEEVGKEGQNIVDTGWVYATSAAKGEIAIISKH